MKQFSTFLLLLVIFTGCKSTPTQVSKGVTDQLAQYRKSVISNITYQLNFAIPDKLKEQVMGSAFISFELKNTEQDLQLDFKGDTTSDYSISCNGKQTVIKLHNDHLVLDKKLLKSGQNEVRLNFTCPDWSLNRNKDFMYTLFVPDRASTAFPCFDQPDLKARFKLTLQIPANWIAVANGSSKTETLQDSLKIMDFNLSKPLPTYLFAFSAGKFDTISHTQNGKTVVLYHREKEEELKNNTDSIFSLIFHSIDWIEKYTDIPYPFEKYDIVAVPSFQYGGMEHPGAILYRSKSLFLDAKPSRQELMSRANLIAHETAHMWFGDMVTMAWFDEVWLKEVFANFIADKVVSPLYPEIDFDLQFQLAHYQSAYSVDRTSGANVINQKLKNMNVAGSLYGSIIYHKAPIVMRMLELKTGAENLQNGLRQYLKENAYGNAGWKDLIGILNQNGTEDLQKWSESWVNEAGRPQLTYQTDGTNLIIEQTDLQGKSRIWPQNIDIIYSIKGKIQYRSLSLKTAELKVENLFGNEKPDWVYLNAKGNVYGYLKMDSLSQSYFLKNFSNLNDDLLQASVLTDLRENVYEGNLNANNLIETLIESIPAEKNPILYERMVSNLETLFLYKTTIQDRSIFADKLEKMLWDEFIKKPAQRTSILNSMINLATTNYSLNKLSAVLNVKTNELEGYVVSADQLNNISLQLAFEWPEKALTILDNRESQINNQDKKEWFQFVRQSINPVPAERDRFFNSLLYEKNRGHEPWVNKAMAFLNHPSHEKESLQYIRPALDKLQEIQRTGDIFFSKSWLDNLLVGHNSKEAAEIVRQFLNDNPEYPEDLKKKILQSADQLMRK